MKNSTFGADCARTYSSNPLAAKSARWLTAPNASKDTSPKIKINAQTGAEVGYSVDRCLGKSTRLLRAYTSPVKIMNRAVKHCYLMPSSRVMMMSASFVLSNATSATFLCQ